MALNSKLQKNVSHAERMKLVKYLADNPDTDLTLKNSLLNTCFEAHADGYGYDEAAIYVEKQYQKSFDPEKEIKSSLFFKDLNNSQDLEKQIYKTLIESK